jgi:hypothetical protein
MDSISKYLHVDYEFGEIIQPKVEQIVKIIWV